MAPNPSLCSEINQMKRVQQHKAAKYKLVGPLMLGGGNAYQRAKKYKQRLNHLSLSSNGAIGFGVEAGTQ